MLYGVVGQTLQAPSSGVAYTANAVHFDGSTSLSMASLSSINNNFFSFSVWCKTTWSGTFPTVFNVDPSSQYSPTIQVSGTTLGFSVSNDGSGGFKNFGIGNDINSPPVNLSVWQHMIGTIRTDGTNLAKWRFDGTDSGSTGLGDSAAFAISTNTKELWIGGDSFGDNYIGDIADLSIWPGVSFLSGNDLDNTKVSLFRSPLGKPVAPSVAIVALGIPPVLLPHNDTVRTR